MLSAGKLSMTVVNKTLAVVAMILLSGCVVHPQAGLTAPPMTPEVRVDERIELLGIVFRLAGSSEYSGRRVPDYADAVDAHFGSFKEHPAVRMAARLREESGISHDAVAFLAVQLGPLPDLKERQTLTEGQLGGRWKLAEAYAFLEQVRAFAVESDAARFFEQQRPLYETAERRMRTLIETEIDIAWVKQFYGGQPDETFIIAPALGNGTWFYGPRSQGNMPELYAVMGVWQVDEDGRPTFDMNTSYFVLHEFGHSYVTPLILSRYDELTPAGDRLLETVGGEMALLGYKSGGVIIHESIVRASVARYKLAHISEAAALRELERQRLLGFLWIDDLYALLGTYESERNQYRTFSDFYPEIRDYFAELPGRLPQMVAAHDAQRPHLIDISLQSGSANIDPSTTTLTVRFDKRMQRKWGFNPGASNTHWPFINVAIDDTQTVITATVSLKPNTDYEIVLIPTQFVSEGGIPMAPYTLRFSTGSADGQR